MIRILRIRSHVGLSRYLVNRTGPGIFGFIPRQTGIPSPYAWGPSHGVYMDLKNPASEEVPVIIVETAHKVYDVFQVPPSMKIYTTDAAASEAFMNAMNREDSGTSTRPMEL